jgi:glucokinase
VVDDQLVVHHRVHRAWRGADRGEALELFVEAVQEIRAASPDVDAIGFGIPSLVDRERGVSVWSNQLPIDDVPFRDLMSERLGLPVYVDNDANVAVLAEHRRGAAQGAGDAVMIVLGERIGGGLILGGKLHRGGRGFAGELGHMTVDLHGEHCAGDCPGQGCFETLVSGRAIGIAGRRAALAMPDSTLARLAAEGRELTGPLITELAHDGDEQASAVLADVGRLLGIGIAGIVNTLDPEVVVIGGEAVASGDLLLDPARAALAERALPPGVDPPPIRRARFGDESGMLGAALLALEGDRAWA